MKTTTRSSGSDSWWFACSWLVLLVAQTVHLSAQSTAAVDRAFDDFWKADDPSEAARAGERLVKVGVDFDTAWARLRAGRPYTKEKTGELSWRYPAGGGTVFDNVVEIPASYDPSRKWQVRVQLHGGVNRPPEIVNADQGLEGDSGSSAQGGGRAPNLARRRGPNRIPGEEQIYVFPSGWHDAEWWHRVQVDNILRLLDRLKRRYNVDESRVYLTGISDGGTGAYFMAMRASTPWSAFLPLNGSILVLRNPDIRADGELYPNNLVNKPLFIVNGGQDRLYPVSHVQTHIAFFERLGVPLVFRPQPSAGHNTSWWPMERAPFEQFVRQHPRQAHPERLSWETELTDRYNRVHWLVIDRLGATETSGTFTEEEFFPRRKPSGRADLVRRANTIESQTRDVRDLTLLLSPEVFDFDEPITVMVNGREMFKDRVTKDVATLLKWAARDNDRTMLYGAELKIQLQ
jgi:predicted esterase